MPRHLMLCLALTCLAGCGALQAQDRALNRIDDRVPFATDSGVLDPEQIVIRDADAWAMLWARVNSNRRPFPALPTIDFATDMVLFAAQGRKPSGGFEILIDRVRIDDRGMIVDVIEREPATGCVVTMALTAPVDIAIVPRYPGSVIFESRTVTTPC